MAETVLVTGGTGFVAGWTIIELLRRGYEVRTTVRSLSKEVGTRWPIAARVFWIEVRTRYRSPGIN